MSFWSEFIKSGVGKIVIAGAAAATVAAANYVANTPTPAWSFQAILLVAVYGFWQYIGPQIELALKPTATGTKAVSEAKYLKF